jgi:hypothetical protein
MGHPAHFARGEDPSMRDTQVEPRSRVRCGVLRTLQDFSQAIWVQKLNLPAKPTDSLAVNALNGACSGPRIVFRLFRASPARSPSGSKGSYSLPSAYPNARSAQVAPCEASGE